MREILGPPLRAAALAAFIAGLLLLFLNPPSLDGAGGILTLIAGALAVMLITAWAVVAMTGEEMPEPEFRRLVDRSEALAAMPPPDYPRASSTSSCGEPWTTSPRSSTSR